MVCISWTIVSFEISNFTLVVN